MEHLGKIVESLALARPIPDRAQQAERLSQELHCCVGPAQRLMHTGDVVERNAFSYRVPYLPPNGKGLPEVGQGRVRAAQGKVRTPNVVQGIALLLAVTQCLSELHRLTVIPHCRIDLTKPVMGFANLRQRGGFALPVPGQTQRAQCLAIIGKGGINPAQRVVQVAYVDERLTRFPGRTSTAIELGRAGEEEQCSLRPLASAFFVCGGGLLVKGVSAVQHSAARLCLRGRRHRGQDEQAICEECPQSTNLPERNAGPLRASVTVPIATS